MAKSDRACPDFVEDVTYIPAAWIGRNARGPVAHHQIRGNFNRGSFKDDENEHYINISEIPRVLTEYPRPSRIGLTTKIHS